MNAILNRLSRKQASIPNVCYSSAGKKHMSVTVESMDRSLSQLYFYITVTAPTLLTFRAETKNAGPGNWTEIRAVVRDVASNTYVLDERTGHIDSAGPIELAVPLDAGRFHIVAETTNHNADAYKFTVSDMIDGEL